MKNKLHLPLISIIIPNYNHALYLKKRIDSILDQTYDNFELILLDDCSTDNSQEILLSYAECSKVSIIDFNKENSGSTFKQWEKGLKYAKGEYVWIAESDDYADLTFLEKTVELVMQHKNIAICYTGSHLVDAMGIKLNKDWDKWSAKEIKNKIYEVYNGNSFIINNLIWKNDIYNASAVLFRRDIFYKINSQYANYKYCGDHLFWIELAQFGDIIKVYKKLNFFRQHSNKVSPKSEQIGLQFIEGFKIFDYIQENYKLSWIKKNAVLGRIFKRINCFQSYINNDKKQNILDEYKIKYGNGRNKQMLYALYKALKLFK